MDAFLTVLHIMVCVTLVAVVLLQRGKGADMGAALGGGASNTLFGARGAGSFLTKLTTGCAILFMLTSLSLSYISTREANVAIFDDEEVGIEESAAGILEETADAESGLFETEAPAAADANALEEIEIVTPAEEPAEAP
jgi:preprotein translocase subunit SecG